MEQRKEKSSDAVSPPGSNCSIISVLGSGLPLWDGKLEEGDEKELKPLSRFVTLLLAWFGGLVSPYLSEEQRSMFSEIAYMFDYSHSGKYFTCFLCIFSLP